MDDAGLGNRGVGSFPIKQAVAFRTAIDGDFQPGTGLWRQRVEHEFIAIRTVDFVLPREGVLAFWTDIYGGSKQITFFLYEDWLHNDLLWECGAFWAEDRVA